MNFNLPDFQSYLNKRKEISSLGKPNVQKAYLNGLKDRPLLLDFKNFSYYERLLRNSFQLQVNTNRQKYEPLILTSYKNNLKKSHIDRAAKAEEKIYLDYLRHVKSYKKGLSRKLNPLPLYGAKQKKERKVRTEVVFCFDASFGMYHFSLFKAINRFIDLISHIDLDHIDVAIVAYGRDTSLVSDFCASKISLLLKTALILPVGGVSVIFHNYKFSAVSTNDLSKALSKAKTLFFNSKHATQEIHREIVILSDGNLSGVVGQDSQAYAINKESRSTDELNLIMDTKKELESVDINISSISLKGDNTNIINELSNIVFWKESIEKLNSKGEIKKEDAATQKKLIDETSYEREIGDTMKLNLYYTQQESLKRDIYARMA